ncbi:MAG TPA: hypothetical protein VN285_02195, partial [Candidatus Deferrimicrobium sp.]|nr:hypothetical protein [Candidatus Deferrimicrobium sp.]
MRPDVTRFNLFRVVTELVATAFLVSLCLVGDLFAQEEKPPPVEIIDFKIIEKDQQLDERGELRLARRLMQEKNYPAAAAVLEGLYEQDTTGAVVINLLLMCYEQLGYFPKVEMLTRRCAKLDPANFVHRMRLAEALARQGRMDEARAAYAEAESLVAPNDTARCRSIVASMIGNGLDSLALTLIDAARARLASPMLFALERGRIYEGRRRFEEASAEYFAALGSDSESIAPEAEKKLLELLKYEESAPLVEKTLLGQVERGVNVGVARILSFFYLEAGQFDR